MIKNILMLTGEWQDVMMTSLYSGLLRLGYNVHIFPFKDDYIKGVHEPPYAIFYNETENVPYEIIKENTENGFYDLLIVGSISTDMKYMPFYKTILALANCPPTISCNSHSDSLNYDYRSFIGKPYICEFRLELYNEKESVYPLFFPTEKEFFVPFDEDNKKYDVFCVFGNKFQHPCYYRRLIVCEVIKDCFPNSIVSRNAELLWPEYHDKLSQSWIGINIRGVGLQTSRYYEIPAHGAALFAERTNLIRYNDFEDDTQIKRFDMQFDNSINEKIILSDLVSNINFLLSNKDMLINMIQSSQKRMECFTVERLCCYILETVKSHL